MARINIEDTLYRDPRWMELLLAVGNKFTALGMILTAWTLAQKYWAKGKFPIPGEEWDAAGLDQSIVKAGLASKVCEGDRSFYMMRGCEEQFEWLIQRQEAGRRGGITSAERRTKMGQALLKQTQANASKSNPLTPSPSLTHNNNKETFEKDDPVSISTRIVNAISRFGYTNPTEAQQDLGTDAWQVVKMSGGWRAVCDSANAGNLVAVKAQLRELAKTVI